MEAQADCQETVRGWITELASAGLIELTEDRGYVLSAAGRDELERLAPTPRVEPVPEMSEEAVAVLQRRLAR
jgi:ribosomal protein S19E (S16A)